MQRISYRLFILILIFCPMAFATVEPWSNAILELLILTSFLLLFLGRQREQKPFYIIPGALPLTLLLCWMAFQLLPMPASVLRLLSPSTYDVYAPLLSVDNSMGWIPLSLNAKATLLSIFKWSALGFFYVLTIYHLKNAGPLKQVITIIAVLCSILAIIALLQKLTSPKTIFWFRPAPASSSPMGPWVYSNQFAGFMEMVFPLIIALFLFYRPRLRYDRNLKNRLMSLLTMPGANRHLLLGSGAILIAVSILLSLSRGGIITLCIAFLFFTLLWAKVTRSRQIQWGIFLSSCVILMITWFGWQPIMNEFGSLWGEKGLNLSGRLPLFQDTLAIFKSFPLVGTGFGTFQSIYPAFRSIPGETVFDHAHNDYLELLSEGGMIGFLLCAWFLTAVIRSAIKTLSGRRDTYSILITCGVLTGILALLLHCLIDFQVANGANALYFFLFLGLAVSVANTRFHYRSRSTFLVPGKGNRKAYLILICLVLLIGSSWYNLSIFRARAVVSTFHSTYLNPYIPPNRLREIHSIFNNAAGLDPLEADYRIRMGRVSTLLNELQPARKEYLQACRLNPFSGYQLQQLGLSLPEDNSYLQEKLIALGMKREPLTHKRYLTFATWLIKNDRSEDAIDVLNQALLNIPDKTADICRYIIRNRFQDDEVEKILPDKTYAWHELARIMESHHQPDKAERYYMRALNYLHRGEILPAYFSRPYSFFLKNKELDKALNILRMAIEYLPSDTWFRIRLGDYYRQEGITYRAKEEYLHGLRIDPDNRELRKRMKEISGVSVQ